MMALSLARILTLATAFIALRASVSHAMDPRFELDTKMLDAKVPSPVKEKPAREPEKQPPREGGVVSHVVKPGDHIFRILMRDYGMSNAEAERIIPDVKKLNRLDDIRRLRVGSRLLIPVAAKAGKASSSVSSAPRKKERKVAAARVTREEQPREHDAAASDVPPMRMVRLAEPPAGDDSVEVLRQVWDKLLPAAPVDGRPVEIRDANYGVSLDPARFPVLPTADGGKIVIDTQGAIPPLVKSLLTDRDPKLKIVTDNPANRRRLFSSVLGAANFYSVEENFVLDFGVDPKLKVRADFKIEKEPDSLLKQDVVLMNVGQSTRSMPDRLVSFLRGEGFKVVEAGAGGGAGSESRGRFYSISGTNPRQVADSVLKALALRYEKDRDLELNSWENRGIKMYVKVDRYIENNGERYAVTWFDGNPVNYTLARLLETVGFKVVVLDEKDDLYRISDKLLTRLRLPGRYGVHSLWGGQDVPYSVEMSGLMVGGGSRGAATFITNTKTSPLIQDLLTFNGYTVLEE